VKSNPAWRVSSYSAQSGGQCVEVAPGDTAVSVRDTKNRAQGHLAVRAEAWKAFVSSVTR